MNMKAPCGGEEEGKALRVPERGPERLGLEHWGVTKSSRRDEPGRSRLGHYPEDTGKSLWGKGSVGNPPEICFEKSPQRLPFE